MKKDILDALPRDMVIPAKLLFDSSIDNEYKTLYAYLNFRCGIRGYVWYTTKSLAEDLEKGVRSIERALSVLAENKLIKIEKYVKKTNKLYERNHNRVIWIYSDYLVAKKTRK